MLSGIVNPLMKSKSAAELGQHACKPGMQLSWDAAVLELHYQLCSPALTDVREHARHKVITPRGAKPCRLL